MAENDDVDDDHDDDDDDGDLWLLHYDGLCHIHIIRSQNYVRTVYSAPSSSLWSQKLFMSRSSKLEKADILEQTVDYLNTLSRQQATETAQGFVTCLHEVGTFLQNDTTRGYRAPLRVQLLAQLSRRARQLASDQRQYFTISGKSFKTECASQASATTGGTADGKMLTHARTPNK